MTDCLFATDLHGDISRYRKLVDAVVEHAPDAVFLGGDLLPHFGSRGRYADFVEDVIRAGLEAIRDRLGDSRPEVFAILGNDDPRTEEDSAKRLDDLGLWKYAHNRRLAFGDFEVYGYAFVPPTPFRNKDWEKYDVSRYVPPGCISPEEGFRTVDVDPGRIRYGSILEDLDRLVPEDDLSRSILLFHTPPYETRLDRVANDGKMIDYVPLDLHVGSIAVNRFIESRQPHVTLHGHIHESARLTGEWSDRIGSTYLFSAAHDGPELSLVRFDLENPASAERFLL